MVSALSIAPTAAQARRKACKPWAYWTGTDIQWVPPSVVE